MAPKGKTLPDRSKKGTSTGARSRDIHSLHLVLSSRAQTESFGRSIGQSLQGGEVLALIGTLGVGKTALVRGIATGLGVPSHCVSSPTFVLAHEYPGRMPLFHIDMYRVKDLLILEASGLSECFTERAAAAVEWADRFPSWLPIDRLEIRLTHRTPSSRDLSVTALGPLACALLRRIQHVRRRSSARTQTTTIGRGKVSTR